MRPLALGAALAALVAACATAPSPLVTSIEALYVDREAGSDEDRSRPLIQRVRLEEGDSRLKQWILGDRYWLAFHAARVLADSGAGPWARDTWDLLGTDYDGRIRRAHLLHLILKDDRDDWARRRWPEVLAAIEAVYQRPCCNLINDRDEARVLVKRLLANGHLDRMKTAMLDNRLELGLRREMSFALYRVISADLGRWARSVYDPREVDEQVVRIILDCWEVDPDVPAWVEEHFDELGLCRFELICRLEQLTWEGRSMTPVIARIAARLVDDTWTIGINAPPLWTVGKQAREILQRAFRQDFTTSREWLEWLKSQP
jgi:hypothetical protein